MADGISRLRTPDFFPGFEFPNDVEIFLNPAWGNNRGLLREALRLALQDETWAAFVSTEELAAVLDLNHVPHFSQISVSISHTASLGGFAISQRPVGFDLEAQSRISDRAVRRVSSDAEVAAAPSPAHLWVAKEAAYKALRHGQQPAVISDVEMVGWKLEKNFWRFQVMNHSSAEGFVGIQEGLGCALCFL